MGLYAPFGVIPVAAHVPFADRAVDARQGIRPAHYPHDEVASCEARAGRRFEDFAERFVAERQTFLAWRRPAIVACDDLDIGAADPDGAGLDQDRAVLQGRFGEVGQLDGVRL